MSLADSLMAMPSVGNFERAIAVPESLLEIHDVAPRDFRVPPTRSIAVNRSAVVMSVAAWQAFVEDYARTVLGLWSTSSAKSRREEALLRVAANEVCRFSTPNSESVRQLLDLGGIDIRERWRFVTGGRRIDWAEAAKRLDQWVQVRHAVAHGDSDLPVLAVLGTTSAGHGSLTRRHARRCIAFFLDLVRATTRVDLHRDQPRRAVARDQ